MNMLELRIYKQARQEVRAEWWWYLPCKHKDLNLITQNPHKSKSGVKSAEDDGIKVLRMWKQVDLWGSLSIMRAYFMSSRLMKDPN